MEGVDMPRIFKKTALGRISDTFNYAQTVFGNDPKGALAAEYLEMELDAAQTQLSRELSLGSRSDIKGRSAETQRRHAVRAVLMGYAMIGNPRQPGKRVRITELAKMQTDVDSKKQAELDQLLKSMVGMAVTIKGKRMLVGMDTSLEENNAVWAMDQIAGTA